MFARENIVCALVVCVCMQCVCVCVCCVCVCVCVCACVCSVCVYMSSVYSECVCTHNIKMRFKRYSLIQLYL